LFFSPPAVSGDQVFLRSPRRENIAPISEETAARRPKSSPPVAGWEGGLQNVITFSAPFSFWQDPAAGPGCTR
jgi:hypothetical protein